MRSVESGAGRAGAAAVGVLMALGVGGAAVAATPEPGPAPEAVPAPDPATEPALAPAPMPTPTPLTEAAPAPATEPAPTALRPWHLQAFFDVGFGFPTGFMGGHAEVRYTRFALGVGAGMGFGGAQYGFGAVATVVSLAPEIELDLGLWASHGPVQSKGDLGGMFGPEHRYDDAWWLSLPLALGLRMMGDEGPLVRLVLGPAILLDPEPGDTGVFMLGVQFGWDFPL